MIGVVYLGNNPKTQERLKYIPGQLVRMTTAYKDAAQVCTPHVSNEHFIVFFERNVRSDTINKDASVTALNKKIQFISDRENILFDDEAPKYKILKFKIPVWKRLFDIVFSGLAIIVLSPIFILTAIAIKLESKGPVLFKSKRVGTNYTIFDFLKFRSMYIDAEERLKDLSKTNNQYAEKEEEEEHKTITAPLGAEAEQDMMTSLLQKATLTSRKKKKSTMHLSR